MSQIPRDKQELTYFAVIKYMKNSFDLHLKMIQVAEMQGVSAAARAFHTTRKTVYKWLNRYRVQGLDGLLEKSRAPKRHPHQIPEELEQCIIAIRLKHPYLGPYRLKHEYHIPCSEGAIYRVIKQAGLTRARKRKYKVKRDLRKLKASMKPLEKIQVDVKELCDIPRYYPYLLAGYPGYEFTARDVRTGMSFICFAHEKNATNAALFAELLCGHLKTCGVDLTQVEIQTDNGSEFVVPYNSKNPSSAFQRSPFEKIIDKYKLNRSRIPPGQKTYNSDVEAFHRLIEDEFFDLEDYDSKKELLSKSYTYMQYFNLLRVNRYKGSKTPSQILDEYQVDLDKDRIFEFKPLILDNLISAFYSNKHPTKNVYYVLESDRW